MLLGLGDDALSVSMGNRINKPGSYPRTDSGNAELFAALYGANVRFDHKRERWLIWIWKPATDMVRGQTDAGARDYENDRAGKVKQCSRTSR